MEFLDVVCKGNEKVPKNKLSFTNFRSPWYIFISIDSSQSALLKVSVLLIGIKEFRDIIEVIIPPSVSTPNDIGTTSNTVTSKSSLTSFLVNKYACKAAPILTTCSWSRVFSIQISLSKISLHNCEKYGIRVVPPTKIIRSIRST